MSIRSFSIVLGVCLVGAGFSVACSGSKVAAVDDASVDGASADPASGGFDTDPASDPPVTNDEPADASPSDLDASGLFDGGVSFPMDAGADGGASFCRVYEDFTALRGPKEVTVQLSPNDRPRVPDPQCFRITKGRAVRFNGDVAANPVVLLGADGGNQVVPPDTRRTDRSTVTFSEPGSFYFATRNNADVEHGHIIVVP